MKKDHRPYIVKHLSAQFQNWYVNYFLRPQFEHLGKEFIFVGSRHIEITGWPITLGDYANVVATPDRKVRLTVWSNREDRGRIRLGDYCLICPGVRISSASEIVIGDNCMMAQGVYITDSDWHDIYDRSVIIGEKSAPIRIGNNVWLGDSVIVCKGVTIGDNSVIGAGAVVVKEIPPNVVAAGNPAVVVKHLDPERELKTRSEWFTKLAVLDEMDRKVRKKNTIFGWLRSKVFPVRGD
ncbi:MAG: acyltransferase [Deltaproteobacteria bacterium]|nr:MAG: acyltransferase [Deltaproteobacteria bacterium]